MTNKNKNRWIVVAVALAVAGASGAAVAFAHPQSPDEGAPGCGGPGLGQGRGHGSGHGGDMAGIHALFANRQGINRSVTEIPGGVRTLTETDDPAVTVQLREHVQAMYDRLKEGRPIHARDPLFAALFQNADKIDASIEKTAKGLQVTETSADPKVVDLIRRHAAVVSLFVENGMPEMMKSH